MTSQPEHLQAFIEKMAAHDLPRVAIDTFAHYYRQLVSGATGLIPDDEIDPVDMDEIAQAHRLQEYTPKGRQALARTVMIVLNGGLGTSMGLQGPKSLLQVKDGKSFLAIILEQATRMNIGLVFMNSFNTHGDTMAAVEALAPKRRPHYFLQHKYPKVLRQSLAPADWPPDPGLEWNPPGHGDIYTALQTSGLLEKLTAEGMTYALIANADNLGATMDLSLLGYFVEHQFPMMMEVARRTPADTKGGHLARRKDGRLLLREIAQCPEADLKRFQDIDRFRFFNTNSIWLNLHALRDRIRENPVIHLPLILNPKTVDPRDKTSPAVFQIETAMGSAISLFEGASAVNVPMERFSPVKKTSDLLALRSDGYAFTTDGTLALAPGRQTGRLQIQLDNRFYSKIDDFERRFAKGIPSLIHCERLDIEGDVYFEKEIAIRGCVHIRNPHDKPATIPAGTVIDGDLTF